MKCFFLKEYIYLTIKSILLRENGDLMMCRRKFTHILTTLEAQFSILQTNLEKDLEEKYLASMRRHSGGGGAMVMIKKETIDGYRDSIDRIINIIKENYNGENNKIYTGYDGLILKNIAEKYRSTMRKRLEDKCQQALSKPTFGPQSQKEQLLELKEYFDNLDQETSHKIDATISYIKHKSWQTWWLVFIAIITSVVTTAITNWISRYI